MSGLYLLGIVALWLVLTSLLWKGWRHWRAVAENGKWPDGVALISALLWLAGSFWYAGGRTIYYDWQVRRMCAGDGGVKVYEKVRLSAEGYDQFAKRNWVLPDKASAKRTDQYYSEYDIHYFRKGSPTVSRRKYQIVRRSDGKVLGESIRYGRGGGDLPGPWHPSSFTCPPPNEKPYLEPSIFVKEN